MQERVKKPKLPVKSHEKMRIAGKRVDTDERIEVRNPYTGAVVGTVPAARPGACARGLRARPKPSSRSSRATSASRSCCAPPSSCATARSNSPHHHGGVRSVLEGFALRSGPRLRRLFLRGPAHHQGRRRDLCLRYLSAGQAAQDLHDAHAARRRDLGDHAVQSSAQHGVAQARARDRDQQPHRARSRPNSRR